MWRGWMLLSVTAAAGFAADALAAQGNGRNGSTGTAVVRFVTEPAGAGGVFYLRGTPEGGTSAGGSLIAVRLRPGKYQSTLVDPGPEFRLAEISCDDVEGKSPSEGDVSEGTVTFHVGAGELVSCVFTLVPRLPLEEARSRGVARAAGVNPFQPPADRLERFPVPTDLPTSAGTFQLPREGRWKSTRAAGRMICPGITVPLEASSESGTLAVLADGTLRGDGLGYLMPLRLGADPRVTGRYAGEVIASQRAVPVSLDVHWQLVTDEWIIGYLHSRATDGTCEMYQTFVMEWVG